MSDKEVFESIEAVRAHYYPASARLLEVKGDELLEFPKRLSEESLAAIQRIATAAGKEAKTGSLGEAPKRGLKEARVPKSGRRDVVPSRSGKGWDVTMPGSKQPVSSHKTQTNAEKAAKRQLAGEGGEVVVHKRDGRIRDKDTVAPARDPHPPKDTKH